MIVDFRVRPTPVFTGVPIHATGFADHPIMTGAEPMPSVEQACLPLLVREMDEAGVDLAVLMGRRTGASGDVSNDAVAEVVARYPGRFAPFAGINPLDVMDALREVDRCIRELHFAGVAVDPGFLDTPLMADDRRLYPVYARCVELGVPVSITTSIFLGPDVSYSFPAGIHRVAVDFPRLRIVVPHAAWPWVQAMIGVAFVCPNVWISPDLYMNLPGLPGASHYVEAARYLSTRMLYGSAYPLRSLGQSVREFRQLPLEPDVRENILWRNARRFLGLPV